MVWNVASYNEGKQKLEAFKKKFWERKNELKMDAVSKLCYKTMSLFNYSLISATSEYNGMIMRAAWIKQLMCAEFMF